MIIPFPIDQWARPLVIIIIITLLGLAFKIFIHSRLRRAAALSKWEGDDVFISSIESQIIFWFFLLGSSLAFKEAPIPFQYSA